MLDSVLMSNFFILKLFKTLMHDVLLNPIPVYKCFNDCLESNCIILVHVMTGKRNILKFAMNYKE